MESSIADPATDPALQQLRQDVLSDSLVSDYINSLILKPIALVLSGGGGKGAYEAGVILALFDCGVRRFDVLAGSSVGALNAVLCHELCRTRKRELVLEMWCDISRDKVLSFTFSRIIMVLSVRVLLGLFMLPVAAILALTDLLSVNKNRSDSPPSSFVGIPMKPIGIPN